MGVFVKRVGLEEAEKVAVLFNAYRVFYEQKSDLALAQTFITERLKNDESVIFVAEDTHGEFVGFTQLYPNFSSVSAKRTWVLNDLYVAPEARRLGAGKALMNIAKEYAIATHAKGIALETAKDNVNAQALYESLGYKRGEGFYSYFLSV